MPLVLEKILKKDSCAVDVGGHVGSFLRLLEKFAPEGMHIVFEPSAVKSGLLKKQFPAVRVVPYAAADETGTAMFDEDYARPGLSALQRGHREQGATTVRSEIKTYRLDDILLETTNPIDLIKLDIEGSELAALRGAIRIIEKWSPAIIFECGPEHWLAERNLSRMSLYKFITEELDYNIFGFADFLFDKGLMGYDEFRKCGVYPFRALNFVAISRRAPGDFRK